MGDHAVHQAGALSPQRLQQVFCRARVTLLWIAPVWPRAPLPTGVDLDLSGGMQQLATDALKASHQRGSPDRAHFGQVCPRTTYEIDARSLVLINRLRHVALFCKEAV